MQRTQIDHYFDRLVCAHDLGLPKEDANFWEKLHKFEPFDVEQTLLIDDSLPVLRSAAGYGFRHLLGIYQPDSQLSPKAAGEFRAIRSFREIFVQGGVGDKSPTPLRAIFSCFGNSAPRISRNNTSKSII
jgi:putative hydrolase of the HAD superfamily